MSKKYHNWAVFARFLGVFTLFLVHFTPVFAAQDPLELLFPKEKKIEPLWDDSKGKPTPEQAHEWLNQGKAYFFGNLLQKKDYKEAFRYLSTAAEYGEPEALYLVGAMYYDGKGVEKNEDKAWAYYEKAAELGQTDSQMLTGTQHMYLALRKAPTSKLREEEFVKAAGWFKKAADKGQAEAILWYGDMLTKGQGMPKNEKEGVKWVERSAEMGNANAHAMLGTYYIEGKVVTRNTIKAYQHLEISRLLGNEIARIGQAMLKPEMEKMSITMATSMAETWMKSHPKFTEKEPERPKDPLSPLRQND